MRQVFFSFTKKGNLQQKVLKILDASPETEAQRITFDHLVRYIKSLGSNVSAFLQFTTGADIVIDRQKS